MQTRVRVRTSLCHQSARRRPWPGASGAHIKCTARQAARTVVWRAVLFRLLFVSLWET